MIPKVEQEAEQAIAKSPSLLVPWYLIASYAYYIKDSPVISDTLYDRICATLFDELDQFNVDHMHMDLCDAHALKAGTAYHLSESDYPSRVKSIVNRFLDG